MTEKGESIVWGESRILGDLRPSPGLHGQRRSSESKGKKGNLKGICLKIQKNKNPQDGQDVLSALGTQKEKTWQGQRGRRGN